MMRRESCRHFVPRTAACIAIAILCAAPQAASESRAEQGYTLVGTCVRRSGDGATPLPDVHILLHPDSTRAVTDAAGDFVIYWRGEPGWMTMTVPDGDPKGGDWCVRMTLTSPSDYQGDLYFDLGSINIIPGRRVHSTRPEMPRGASPQQIPPVPDPGVNEPVEGTVRFKFATDIHGNLMELEMVGTDDPPARVAAAVEEWLRGLTWSVGTYTVCDSDLPFSGDTRVSYAWKDGSWHFDLALAEVDRRQRQGRPGASDQ